MQFHTYPSIVAQHCGRASGRPYEQIPLLDVCKSTIILLLYMYRLSVLLLSAALMAHQTPLPDLLNL